MPFKKEIKDNILIVITGATAVGKTSVSIELAKKLHCDIISADSRQIYKEMNTGTAKPALEEMQGVPHHFIDHVSIFDNYDAGIYEKEVIDFLEHYYNNTSNTAILCGGTGMYIEAVTRGLDEFPDIPAEIKNKYTDIFNTKGLEHLQEELKNKDKEYYNKVDIYNPHRLIRALSVIDFTGKKFSHFLKGKSKKRNFITVFIRLDLPRDILYQRINTRVDDMVNAGLIDEARTLYPHRKLKALQTVGYKELFDFFDGKISETEAIELIKRNTRRYAKRQITWFGNRGSWNVFSPFQIQEIMRFVEKNI